MPDSPTQIVEVLEPWVWSSKNDTQEYCEQHSVTPPAETTQDDLPKANHSRVEEIDQEAFEKQELAGKWTIFLEEDEVDEVWGRVRELVEEGKIWNSKVSTKGAKELKNRENYVIIVYTPNYIDKFDVFRVRDILRDECGITDTLYYKPDIYTRKGIYSDSASDFGLPGASRYSG